MPRVILHLSGQPQTKGRPRVVKHGKHVHTYTPKHTKNYENYVRGIGEEHFEKPTDQPVKITMIFRMKRPSYITWKTIDMVEVGSPNRPDLSNLEKAVEDALDGVAYRDDGQIYCKRSFKVYHSGDGKPETIVIIEWEEEEESDWRKQEITYPEDVQAILEEEGCMEENE